MAVRLGQILRARRRQLDLTQEEVAKRIKSSQSSIYLLESGKRGLSETIMKRLAKVLGFDARKFFFLARPIINLSPANPVLSARKGFKNGNPVRRFRDISDAEMEMLSRVASLGEFVRRGSSCTS